MSDTLDTFKKGDEVVIRGTIDSMRGSSVWLVVDGASIGRVVRVPLDVLAEKVGTSPNYRKEGYGEGSKA